MHRRLTPAAPACSPACPPGPTRPQVYYAPRLAFTQAVTLPTLFGGFALLRCILLREGINLVHAHQASLEPGSGVGLAVLPPPAEQQPPGLPAGQPLY